MDTFPPVALSRIHILTDFDGTITNHDTLERLLDRFGTPEWIAIEKRLEQGLLTVDDAFQQQMTLLDVSLDEALETLDKTIQVDTTIGECAQEVIAAGGKFTIISAGFHEIIAHMLDGKIPEEVNIYANRIQINDNHWTVIPSPSPKLKGLCTHCKRYWVEQAKQQGDYIIYVGDGFTDRCPAEAADRVYARKSLWEYRIQQGLPTSPFRDFRSIWQDLINTLKD